MFEKVKIDKEQITKIVTVLIIAAVALMAISVLTDNNDSRTQISSNKGETEDTLCSILTDIKGVGEVDTMIQYDEKSEVTGVIVTAQGASDPVVKNNILNGVATLFDIPVSNVMVFEKNQEEEK